MSELACPQELPSLNEIERLRTELDAAYETIKTLASLNAKQQATLNQIALAMKQGN